MVVDFLLISNEKQLKIYIIVTSAYNINVSSVGGMWQHFFGGSKKSFLGPLTCPKQGIRTNNINYNHE